MLFARYDVQPVSRNEYREGCIFVLSWSRASVKGGEKSIILAYLFSCLKQHTSAIDKELQRRICRMCPMPVHYTE